MYPCHITVVVMVTVQVLSDRSVVWLCYDITTIIWQDREPEENKAPTHNAGVKQKRSWKPENSML
jgi:hypothetical protein